MSKMMPSGAEATAESVPTRSLRGRQARQQLRLNAALVHRPTLVRDIPIYDLIRSGEQEFIHKLAMTIVREVGVRFEDPESLALWKDAGASVDGSTVRLDEELLIHLIAKTPSTFVYKARNDSRSAVIGGRNIIFHPPGGAFIGDLEGRRRRATKDDLPTIVKLVHCLSSMHVSTGWPAIDLSDVPVPVRHLYQIYYPMRYSDKPLTANAYSMESAEDAINMARILFGRAYLQENVVLTTLVNANTPLKWDKSMLDGLKVFARARQAVICSPFVLYGASTPPNVVGAAAQVLAEALMAIALIQIINPGTPAVLGVAPMGVSMKSGAPTWGVPAVSQMMFVIGQMAAYYRLPWRVSGPKSGSKIVDYCAGTDAATRAYVAIMAGANWISHAAGSLEGGMQLNLGKMTLDNELMEGCYLFASGLNFRDTDQVLDMLKSVGEASHFLDTDYLRQNMPFSPSLQDNETHDTWMASGGKDGSQRGIEAALALLRRYDEIDPGLESSHDEELKEYIDKAEIDRAGRII